MASTAPQPGPWRTLLDAAAAGDLVWVKGLLAAKADANAKSGNGYTALMIATAMRRQDVVKFLEKAGAGEWNGLKTRARRA